MSYAEWCALRGTPGGVGRGLELATAWMVRAPTSPAHERPSQGLAGLVERIGAVRGAAVACYGNMDLLVRDAHGAPRRILQADQTVYLHPSQVELLDAEAMVVGEHRFPDVVLEVDHTTDVRRGKLRLPPRCGWRCRSGARRAARGGACRGSLARGRCLPGVAGLRAEAVHEALNELERRADIPARRVGQRGAREGTGPAGCCAPCATRAGREAREVRAGMVREILISRGIERAPTRPRSPDCRRPPSSRRRSPATANGTSTRACAGADPAAPAFPCPPLFVPDHNVAHGGVAIGPRNGWRESVRPSLRWFRKAGSPPRGW